MNRLDPESYIRSSENPNALYEAILDSSFTDKVPEFDDRLAIVSADIAIYLCNIVGVDREVAEQVSQRALRGVLAATAITLDTSELTSIFAESERLTKL